MSWKQACGTIAASLAVLGLLACAHEPSLSGSDDLGREAKPLEALRITDLPDRLRVEVAGNDSLAYDMSTSLVPASVTVDLPGLSKGTDLRRLQVNKPPLLEVIPTEVSKPRAGLQLVFMLTMAVEPELRVQGTSLIIDFPKTNVAVAEAEGAHDDTGPDGGPQASPVAPSPSAGVGPPAKTMTKVEVQRGEGEATVVIYGDGEFTYDVRPLNHDRLIVDLARVDTPLRLQVLPVDHPLLKQIRIGHHSQKVRLVFDLPKRATYVVQSGSTSLAIKLTALVSPEPSNEPNVAGGLARESEPRGTDRREEMPQGSDSGEKKVRIAPAGSVPFPERLARIAETPRLGQMAPEAKGTTEPEEIGQPRYVGRKISLDFQAADITNVLRLIADVSGFNIVVGEGVKAKVTLKLVSVPWDQALDMLLKMNNLGMIREGTIVWIDTLANIARQQDEEAKAKESKVKAEDLVTRIIYVQNVPAAEIQTTLAKYLSPRGQLTLNAASNAIVIQDTETRVKDFAQLVRELDLEVPQIQIEARIVQADTTYIRSLGVQWGFQNLTSLNNNRVFNFSPGPSGDFGSPESSFLVNLPAAIAAGTTVPSAGITFGKATESLLLDLRLSAGESLGMTKVIAAPKITTLDKRDAKIEQGEAIPFVTTSLQGTQTTFVDALLSLQITPQITSRDPKEVGKQILLKIKATRNAVGASSNPTVIGIPFFSRLPVIGWLFKSKTENVSKKELLIFLTPIIVKS
jgi:type IV pilus assembly protein PilQ